jgi:hypothetical protein
MLSRVWEMATWLLIRKRDEKPKTHSSYKPALPPASGLSLLIVWQNAVTI